MVPTELLTYVHRKIKNYMIVKFVILLTVILYSQQLAFWVVCIYAIYKLSILDSVMRDLAEGKLDPRKTEK